MKEKLTAIPNVYSETPAGEGVVCGIANGMLQLQNKDSGAVTFIGAGWIKLLDGKGQEIFIDVVGGSKITINGKEV